MTETRLTPDYYAAQAWRWRGVDDRLASGYANIADTRPFDPEKAASDEVDMLTPAGRALLSKGEG